jgi:hypothetical protein
MSTQLMRFNNVKRKRFRFIKGYKTYTRVRKHYKFKKLYQLVGKLVDTKKIYNTDMYSYASRLNFSYKSSPIDFNTSIKEFKKPPFFTKTINTLKNHLLKSSFTKHQTINFKLRVKSATVRSRTKQAYIFQNLGMFLNSLSLRNQKNPFTYKYVLKKKIFSFLYPNEVRNALMNRKKKITSYKLLFNFKKKLKLRPRFNLASFNKLLLQHYKISLQSHLRTNTSLWNVHDITSKNTLFYKNYLVSQDEIIYPNKFQYRGTDFSFKTTEVKIPRVRFKPGYQRM